MGVRENSLFGRRLNRFMFGASILLGFLVSSPGHGQMQPPPLLSTWPDFWRPWDIAFDASGNIYVAEYAWGHIRVLSHEGSRLRVFAYRRDAIGPDTSEFMPYGVAVNGEGTVFVAANLWPTSGLALFTTSGEFLGLFPQGGGPGEYAAAEAVEVDGEGNVYVAEDGTDRIQVATADGKHLRMWGQFGSGRGQFNGPGSMVVASNGFVYVADRRNHRIQVFSETGEFVRMWGRSGNGPGEFSEPNGLALDAAGNLYVADIFNHRIQVFSATGKFLTQWGTRGRGPGQFDHPAGLAIDSEGLIYVADAFNDRLQIFGALTTPVKTTSWGRLKALYR